jgi:hypothetical protein
MHTASRNQDPCLLHLQGESHCLEQSKLFMAFAGSLRQGKLHRGRPPSAMLVIETTLREVARFLDSWGLGDPRRSTPGQPFLDAPFCQHDQKMEGGGPGPQATASAPQLHSPPNHRGVWNFPGPTPPHLVGPYSRRLLLPPASGRIHPDHPTQGAAQMHCPSLEARYRIVAPNQDDSRGLPVGMPSPSRWGNHKPCQPKEWSEGCQSIPHTIGGPNHKPVQVPGKIGGRHPWPPRQHRTPNFPHCNQNLPGNLLGDTRSRPPGG